MTMKFIAFAFMTNFQQQQNIQPQQRWFDGKWKSKFHNFYSPNKKDKKIKFCLQGSEK